MKLQNAIILVLTVLAVRPASAANGIEIEKQAQQRVMGWGVAVSEEIVVDLVAGRQYTKKNLVFTGLKPDIVKIGIRDNGKYTEPELIGKIKLLADSGLTVYIMYEESIPSAYTQFGKVNTFDREVRAADRETHLNYLMKLFEAIQKAGLPLPQAYSMQVPIEQSILRAAKKSTESDDWSALGSEIARRFQEEFGSKLDLIGPDAQNVHDTVSRILAPDSVVGPSANANMIPSGFSLGFCNLGAGRPDAQSLSLFSSICTDAARNGTEIWMTGWSPSNARTEQEACVAAAQRIAGELSKFKVNYWLWGTGYTSEHSSTALVYADGETTRLYNLFQRLWGKVRPGFVVHSVSFDDPELGTSPGYADANGIAFENGGKTVLLLVNPTGADKTATLATGEAVNATAWRFGDKPDSTETKPEIADHVVHLALPAGSVTVVELTN